MACSLSQSMIRCLSFPSRKKYSFGFDATLRAIATKSRATAAISTTTTSTSTSRRNVVYHDTLSSEFWTHPLPLKKSIQFHTLSCDTHSVASRMNFSTQTDPAQQTKSEGDLADEASAPTAETAKTYKRSPSVLTQLPSDFTPEQAWKLLKNHLAGNRQVRLDDLVSICRASRPHTMEDAKIIRKALFELNRFNHLMITIDAAKDAVEGMMRSAMGQDTDRTAEFHLRAGTFVGNIFVKEEYGLYVAVETEVLNEHILQVLLDGIQQYNNERLNEEEQSDKMEKLVNDSANVAKKVIDTLLTRASNPTKDMKKRKKRKYLKYLRCSAGPTPESIDLAVRICLSHCNPEQGVAMAREILDAYEERPFLGTAKVETSGLVQEYETRMKEKIVVEEDEKKEES